MKESGAGKKERGENTDFLAEFERLQKADQENEVLIALYREIALLRDKNDLSKIVQNKLKKLFAVNDIYICLLDDKKKNLTPFLRKGSERQTAHPNFENIIKSNFPITQDDFGEVLKTKNPAVFDIRKIVANGNCFEHMRFLLESGLTEALSAPLFDRDEIIGAFTLFSEKKNTFQPENFRLIQNVSSQLSIAVVNILANENIRQREKEKEILLSVSSDIANTREKKDLLHVINSKMKNLFYFTHSAIGIFNADRKTFRLFLLDPGSKSVTHPDYQKVVTNPAHPFKDGVFDKTIESDSPIFFDLESFSQTSKIPVYLRINKDFGIKESVMIALRKDGENIGVLGLFSDRKGSFSSNNLRIIEGISNQLSIAVSNILANEKIANQLEEINRYRQQLEEENLSLQKEINLAENHSEIIGSSEAMQRVFQLISQVAPSDSTVLIMGETGTGKELIARAIHNSSTRKDKLMIRVNCTTLPANLIESELFGHEKGTFTGASERRLGKFELANNGTVFLDEIGEMPLELQAKLLCVLQEKEIERIGGKTPVKVNVRVIAATNRNLQKEVSEGRFRTDLFFRLNVFPINLPPLRERKADIPLLASHFISRYAKKTGKKITGISHQALADLMTYNWAGNVRELEHLIERSILLASNENIKKIHLPSLAPRESETDSEDFSIKSLDENEREYILKVLKTCRGKVSGANGAAHLLGVPTSTLNSKMKKLGIHREHIFSKDGG